MYFSVKDSFSDRKVIFGVSVIAPLQIANGVVVILATENRAKLQIKTMIKQYQLIHPIPYRVTD